MRLFSDGLSLIIRRFSLILMKAFYFHELKYLGFQKEVNDCNK